MPEVSNMDVLLHGKPVGTMTLLPDDRTLFAFTKAYIADEARPTLSLSFKDQYGGLAPDTRPTRVQVPTFFSNLLPEGHLRDYLARRAGVHPTREYFLLWVLGSDLAGAVQVRPADGAAWPDEARPNEGRRMRESQEAVLRFSLAGVQLKFSAVKGAAGGLTIPADGAGGSWIVKLPSTQHEGLPENEFAMMELARRVGIDVPETKLIAIDSIAGLPEEAAQVGAQAFAIKRFDRLEGGARVHIEDFAQIFGLYPARKYERANYEMIAGVLAAETGEEGAMEFVRRFVFNALIGNGDMHLKNWSVIYPDTRATAIAPAYDFVATAAYMKNESLALNFAGSKSFADLTLDSFDRFADRAKLPARLVRDTVGATVERFHVAWKGRGDLPVAENVAAAVERQLANLPFVGKLS